MRARVGWVRRKLELAMSLVNVPAVMTSLFIAAVHVMWRSGFRR